MVEGIRTINILKPKEYGQYKYNVNIDGKKTPVKVEEYPNGRVKILVDRGDNNVEVINTDKAGLLEFNQKYMIKPILYNTIDTAGKDKFNERYQPSEDSFVSANSKTEAPQEKNSLYNDFMRKLALMSLTLRGIRNPMNYINPSLELNNQMLQQQMVQQHLFDAQQAHMTAVQMSTPGMGII